MAKNKIKQLDHEINCLESEIRSLLHHSLRVGALSTAGTEQLNELCKKMNQKLGDTSTTYPCIITDSLDFVQIKSELTRNHKQSETEVQETLHNIASFMLQNIIGCTSIQESRDNNGLFYFRLSNSSGYIEISASDAGNPHDPDVRITLNKVYIEVSASDTSNPRDSNVSTTLNKVNNTLPANGIPIQNQGIRQINMNPQQAGNTEEPSYKMKCPFSGELMTTPVKAYDGVVYENRNIQKWFQSHKKISPITGKEMIADNLSIEFQLRGEIWNYLRQHPPIVEHHTFSQVIQSLIKDVNDWLAIILLRKPKPLPKPLTLELAKLRTMKTFHCITHNQFLDSEIDTEQLYSPGLIKENLPLSWWPISEKQELSRAVWGACKRLRANVYIEFHDAVSTVNYKQYADLYFPPRMINHFTGTYQYVLLGAMEDCLENLLPVDIPFKDKIKEKIKDGQDYETGLLRWRNLWGEWPRIRGDHN